MTTAATLSARTATRGSARLSAACRIDASTPTWMAPMTSAGMR